MNDCCKGCYMWEQFGKECYYWWNLKKFCPSREGDDINDRKEMADLGARREGQE